MSRQWARVVAALTGSLSTSGYLFSLITPDLGGDDYPPLSMGLPVLTFLAAGYLLNTRVPGNAVGPLCAGIALALPSARWRWVARVGHVATVLALVTEIAAPGRIADQVPGTENRLGASWADELAASLLVVILGLVVGLGALVVRYRRGTAADRTQLQWVAAGALLLVLVVLPALIFSDDQDGVSPGQIFLQFLQLGGLAILPVAIGIAVLRRGLYDLGLVLRRTLAYTVLTALLAGVYVGLVLLVQFLLDPLTEGSGVAVAVSTLAVAALFRPARARIQLAVDRRFFRSQYDAPATVAEFAGRLRDELDVPSVAADQTATTGSVLQPDSLSLWLVRR